MNGSQFLPNPYRNPKEPDERAREEAIRLLTSYIQMIMVASNLRFDSDNASEIRLIVDNILIAGANNVSEE